jgi:hypothetical protein
MTGGTGAFQLRRNHEISRRIIAVSLAALIAMLVGGMVMVPTSSASTVDFEACGRPVAPDESKPKQINLVLDDSGSMFHADGGQRLLDRWSKAKYALEVFAALMNPNDTLTVYRLSDFAGSGGTRQPFLEMSGQDSPDARVGVIRAMQLEGRGTPFAAVEKAFEDLLKSPDPDRWLVVVTDGEFEVADQSIDEKALNERLREFVKESQTGNAPIKIAYLAIGEGIPTVTPDRKLGIFSEEAPNADQLLLRMNDLADRVFGRRDIQLPGSGIWAPGSDSIDLAEAIVFAQGAGVSVGPEARIRETSGQEVSTSGTVVDVSWSENKAVELKKRNSLIQALPDRSLQGQVAFFTDLPRGEIAFEIQNAAPGVPIQVFYRPQAALGYVLLDPTNGEEVVAGQPVEGEYQVQFFFADSECNELVSNLLGEQVIDQVTISQGGNVIATDVKSGDIVKFPKGEVSIDLAGTYLDGVPIANPTPLTRSFVQRALPGSMVAEQTTYLVSEMAEFPPPDQQIPLRYFIVEDGVERLPTASEWATLDPENFSYEHDSNLEFAIEKNETPGDLRLLVRAPDGDVFAATTGPTEVTVRGSYLPGQTEDLAQATVGIDVVDDLSFWDRLANWFSTIGWKILLALLLLAILLGYIFKRRFSKKMKRRPEIVGTPRMVGMTAVQDRGKFQANGFRKFLPFVANTATLSYVPPGTTGFRQLKLKAGPKKSMIVTNWKEIAERDNVEINGTPLNSETRKPPRFMPGSTITAATPQMTYELQPNA